MKTRQWVLTGLAAAAIAGLTACGGGSTQPNLTVQVQGLQLARVLTVEATPVVGEGSSSVSVSSSSYASTSSSLELSAGNYNIAITAQPQGQLCVLGASAVSVLSTGTTLNVQCHVNYLNDTGIEAAPTGVTNSDASQGRDAQADILTKAGDGPKGFDYTKLCSDGEVVDAVGACPTNNNASNEWSCVKDNITGLVWDKDTSTAAVPLTPTAGWCGLNDWRQPTVHELLSMVDAGKASGVATSTDYFDDGVSGLFVANETHLNSGTAPWGVNFGGQGEAGQVTAATSAQNLRYVAGISRLNDVPTYTRIPEGSDFVIVDTERDLMWLISNTPLLENWTGALSSATTVNADALGGYKDWRLPNRNELDSLVDRSSSLPAVDTGVYGDVSNAATFSQAFWTSSPVSRNNALSWAMDLSYGDLYQKERTQNARVIYVRNRTFGATP